MAELRGRGDPGGMRRQEALAGTASEAGREGEQPRPAGLGCRTRAEPGGPQESRQQCEFSFTFKPWQWWDQ